MIGHNWPCDPVGSLPALLREMAFFNKWSDLRSGMARVAAGPRAANVAGPAKPFASALMAASPPVVFPLDLSRKVLLNLVFTTGQPARHRGYELYSGVEKIGIQSTP